MNLLSSFNDFYSSLSSDSMFFFWIIVFLFLFLIFLTIVLILKNKKLIKLLKEEQNNSIEKERELENISEVSNNESKEQILEVQEKIPYKEEISKKELKEENKEEETGPYKKNVLRGISTRMQTSPIHIDRNKEDKNYGFNELNLREESLSPLEAMEDNYEINDNMKFASEIVEKMEEQIKPSNIELTDYEKKQEEEAIISYDELLKVKDKIYNITEDEDTDEFIDELKSFRLDL